MIWTDNPERDFARYDAEQAEIEKMYPECDCCGNRIYEKYYEVFDHIICEDCIDDMKVYVEV